MTWRLYYDGFCNLCHRSQLRAARWADRRGQLLEIVPLQHPDAVGKGYGDAMVLEAERTYVGADAWIRLLSLSSAPWLSPLLGSPMIRPFVRLGYGVVARYRKAWFGTRACPIQRPNLDSAESKEPAAKV
ncbi:MAG: thiol-disulfide oxidoreductase DCC family protein [Fimbriimonadaceae bacterium]